MRAEAPERTSEIAEVRAWLDTAQVVVLVGPPGIGKSHVAGALGASAWVSAEALHDGDELVGRMARQLGCPVERTEAVLDALDALELLVVDGYDLGPNTLDDLLRSWSERVPLVVTSRVHLPCFPAHVTVGPLAAPAGAALLRARVRDGARAARLPQARLEELSDALDGVPLALQVVADRLRLYEPADLLDRVRALGDGAAGSLGGALVDALSLGLEALSPSTRAVLHAAALLPGRFDVATLAAVAGRDVDDAVLELLDASLLQSGPGTPPTLRLLAPVRAAVRHGGGAMPDGALERLAAHVLPVAEAAAAEGSPDGMARVGQRREQLEVIARSGTPADRFRAALAWGARERRCGSAAQLIAWDARLPEDGPTGLRVAWGLLLARACLGALRPDEATAALDRIAPFVDDAHRADVCSVRSFLAVVRGDPDQAASLARQAIALRDVPRFHLRLGTALFECGRQDEAAAAFQRARHDSDPFRRGHATYGLCTALLEKRSSPHDILELVAEAEADDALAYPWLACRLQFLRATALGALGEVEAAQAHFAAAGRMHRLLGEGPSERFMELNARLLDFAAGRVPTSLLTARIETTTPFGHALLTVLRAVTHAVSGHHDAAEAMAGPAVRTLHGLHERQARWAGALLAVAFASSRPEVARAFLPDDADDPTVRLARQIVDGEVPAPDDSIDQRVFLGIVGLTRRRVVVQRDGGVFVGEDGQRVDIARRRVLAKVLATLAQAEERLDVDGICAAVWPGERLVAKSGTRRVHVAISTLRGLGLKQAIRTDVTGDRTTWWLDAVRVDAFA